MKRVNSQYAFIRDLTPRESSTPNRVGLYSHSQGDVVIKRHASHNLDADAQSMINETRVLQFFSKIQSVITDVSVPSYISYERANGVSELIMSAMPGKHSVECAPATYVEGLSKAITYLESSSAHISKNNLKQLPLRTPVWYVIRIGYYALKEFIHNPLRVLTHTQILLRALWNYTCVLTHSYNPVLTHGGLYSDSILFDQKQKHYAIIDWESAHLAHPVAEVASVYIFHNKSVPIHEMKTILAQRIASRGDIRMFELISVYMLLSLGEERKHFFKKSSLAECLDTIYSLNRAPSQSPYERIHHLTFMCIARLIKMFPFMQVHENHVILCYHSISNSGWRYATPIETFKEHVAYLHAKRSIVSLEEIISGNAPKGSVAITFDDAYVDVYENAFPILRNVSAVGTVFALGSPENSCRDELDNSYDMMTDTELKQLARAGWEIGYHTDTHPDLHSLSDVQLASELISTKNAMEKRTGLTLRYFAYPKGKYSTKITGIVKEGGYEAGFTVDGGKLSLKNAYAITRLPTEGVLSTEELDAQMSSLGLFVGQVYMSILILKDKIGTFIRRNV